MPWTKKKLFALESDEAEQPLHWQKLAITPYDEEENARYLNIEHHNAELSAYVV